MNKRREFLKIGVASLVSMGFFLCRRFSGIRWVYAEVWKIILPKGTKRESLVGKDPESLDTRNLEITPLEDFKTMGVSDHNVNLKEWRLEVIGHEENSLRFTYSDILALPSIEKQVLLICPGIFANHGRWKGVSMKALLNRVGVGKDVTHVTFSGPTRGTFDKVEKFPKENVLNSKVFLAYEVNGQPLPRRHGFPLRVVAEGYYGHEWVKYVFKLTLEKS
jgi:sulfoxide reductase catalytic subunit YedY